VRTNSDLKSRAEHIMRLMDQRDELSEDIKNSFDVAKSVGFNPAALRKAIQVARMEASKRAKHESAQSDLLIYLEEIEGRAMREAAE
tara:strand:- start:194 stop:454 length:261 start_codon:yes stop_codon:yes gene_type:complete